MNVYCIVMFEFNYSVGDIKNSDLGEGIVCLGGREVGEMGEGSGGKGEGSGGKGGVPTPPVHPIITAYILPHSFTGYLDS